MGAASDYAEEKIGKAIFQNATWTAGSPLFIAFGTGGDDTGLSGEPVGNAYARVSQTMIAGNWPEDGTIKGKFTNAATITTATPTGAGWGTLDYVALYDASSAGNMICWAQLDAPVTANAGVALQFPIGGIVFVID